MHIQYTTRHGHVVRLRYTRANAVARLAWLDAEEERTQKIAPTDSGDVRDNYNREAAALRAAL